MKPRATAGGAPARPGATLLLVVLAVLVCGSAGDEPGPRSTPRAAVQGYLNACRKEDYAGAAAYLDLQEVSPEFAGQGSLLARELRTVLDQKLWIDPEALADSAHGVAGDGLPPEYDRVGKIATRRGEVDIQVRRRTGTNGTAEWRVAPSTVRRIPALYQEFGYGKLGDLLPAPLFSHRFLTIQAWQWIALPLLILVAYAVAWLSTGILFRLLQSITQRTQTEVDDLILKLTVRPARFLVALGFFTAGIYALRFSAPAFRFFQVLGIIFAVVVTTWLLTRILDVMTEVLQRRWKALDRRSAAAILPLGSKAAKVVLVILASITMLQNLGVNITGLMAGLGVGGLALALAAQKTVENLFGGVSLTADQVVRVGDLCRFGDKMGVIEDVGLRSTRIRTADRTLITAPNAEFSNTQIENFAARDRMLLLTVLGLRYETTPDQMRHVLTGLRKLLVAHPRAVPGTPRVRFVQFGPHSLHVEIFVYFDTVDLAEFLAIREDLFLRIMDVVEASGTGFALPSQTLYHRKDGGLPRDRAAEAEAAVRAWRAAGELPFPDLPPDVVASLENSLDYPPVGSRHPGPRAPEA